MRCDAVAASREGVVDVTGGVKEEEAPLVRGVAGTGDVRNADVVVRRADVDNVSAMSMSRGTETNSNQPRRRHVSQNHYPNRLRTLCVRFS